MDRERQNYVDQYNVENCTDSSELLVYKLCASDGHRRVLAQVYFANNFKFGLLYMKFHHKNPYLRLKTIICIDRALSYFSNITITHTN
ncbi:hypothetical protein RR48_05841 [Papilio machaon]|uniref:Uncharacterized protein n=1 Tax=Papilio machaon TaxID=76193 RepID=A0A0N0PB51_PAPMA|nr:hypothetical protein RR48_05841 [Papilio machaon]